MRIAVTGAAGFIGHHLMRYLHSQVHIVWGADIEFIDDPTIDMPGFQWYSDLRKLKDAKNAITNPDTERPVANRIYALAANMGGMGHIANSQTQGQIMSDNALINLNTIIAATSAFVQRVLFTSSVCVYPQHLLTSLCPEKLTEEQAIPANPQDSYGWEKLFSEQLYTHYRAYGLETRIVRLENTYGPECDWRGSREKAPAALCRKVAVAKLRGEDSFEIWGDGEQRRTFMYIDDCVRGLVTVMESDEERPVNLGPDESVSIDELADLIMEIAGVDLRKVYVEGPQGVRGRNFSHERAKSLGWSAQVSLRDGMTKTYEWIEKQVEQWLQSGTTY